MYAHGFSHPAFLELPKVGCPVDLACGGEAATFGKDVLTAMAGAARPGPASRVFPELGHFGPLERPAVVAEAMIRAFDTPPA